MSYLTVSISQIKDLLPSNEKTSIATSAARSQSDWTRRQDRTMEACSVTTIVLCSHLHKPISNSSNMQQECQRKLQSIKVNNVKDYSSNSLTGWRTIAPTSFTLEIKKTRQTITPMRSKTIAEQVGP